MLFRSVRALDAGARGGRARALNAAARRRGARRLGARLGALGERLELVELGEGVVGGARRGLGRRGRGRVGQARKQVVESVVGWGWGTLWSTATTAVKAAEGMVAELQHSEEGRKWATQVGALRGLGGCPRPARTGAR